MTALIVNTNLTFILLMLCLLSVTIYIGALAKAERKLQKVMAFNSIFLVALMIVCNLNSDFSNIFNFDYNLDNSTDASFQDFNLVERFVLVIKYILNLV